MKINKDLLQYSPQDLLRFLDSKYTSWMDRSLLFNKDLEEKKDKDEEKTTQKMLFKEGNIVEKILTDKIKNSNSKDFATINTKFPDIESHWDDTLFAMETGAKYIYQAYLRHDNFAGYADILVRVDDVPSNFGNYSYTVKDIKRAQVAKGKFILQICAYCDLLEKIQGVLPTKAYVILGNGDEEEFLVNDYFQYYLNSKQEFYNFQKNYNSELPPSPLLRDNNANWSDYAKSFLIEKQDLSLIANIEKEELKKLKETKINNLHDLLNSATNPTQLHDDVFERLKLQARIQTDKEPQYIKLRHNNDNPKGLQNLSEKNPKDIYLDIQWSESLEKESFIFLFNVYYTNDKGEMVHEKFEAYRKEFEERTLKRFLGFLRKTLENEGKIYHYGKDLPIKLMEVASQYDTGLSMFQELVFKNRFVDLDAMIRQSFVLAVEIYNIPSISQFTDFPYLHTDSEETFFSLIRLSKIEKHKAFAIEEYAKIVRDKMLSLQAIHNWLIKLQKKEELDYIPLSEREYYKTSQELNDEDEDSETEEVKEESLASMDFFEFDLSTYQNANAKDKIVTLIKQLKKFHAHESRPKQLEKQEILALEDSLLVKNPRCLAYLAFKEIKEDAANIFIYRYNPKQETKIKEGDTVTVKQNKMIKGTITKMDAERGELELKIAIKKVKYLKKYNIITILEDGFLPHDSIENAIKAINKNINAEDESLGLTKAMFDFLSRREPDIKNIVQGTDLYDDNLDLLSQAKIVTTNMNNTTIVFQGPPGAGKTFTSANIISNLVKQGFKVGVSSNSHKAINNLLIKLKEMDKESKIIKLGGEDEELNKVGIEEVKDKDFASNMSQYNVVGGTVFKFAKDVFNNYFDYLFIDEAGQVSLANLLAMSKSTKNIILVGDQMQLEQPIQAIHPGDSGKSALEYYLGNYKTIPKSFGFFLPITRRMHPDLCKIVSDNFYESKLMAHESTSSNTLTLKDNKYIHKNSGVQFIPVWHEDNVQYADEEIEMIKTLVEELEQQEVCIHGITRKVSQDDIIIVSPYNMQVRKIKAAFPKIKSGSVDLFQGQEAPIVIVSLASSSSGGRGIEFLLSENRMNVALSRAQCLALLVASPNIAKSNVSKLEELKLINIFCRLMNE